MSAHPQGLLASTIYHQHRKCCRLCRRPVSDREYLMLLRHVERNSVVVPTRQHITCWIADWEREKATERELRARKPRRVAA